MNPTRLIAAFIILTCLVLKGNAQNKRKDCKEMVLKQIRKMADHNKPKKGHFFQFSIHSNTIYQKDSETADSELTMDIIIGADKCFYNTDYFSIYSDRVNQFVILHPQQVIQWDQALTDELKQEQDFIKMIANEDSLVRTSELCNCEEEKTSEGKYRKGVFKTNADVQAKSGLKEMEVWVDMKNHEIYKVVNWFNSKSKVHKQEVIYKNMDYNYKGKVPKSAVDMVFSEPGILATKFKNYEIIDQRKEGFYYENDF